MHAGKTSEQRRDRLLTRHGFIAVRSPISSTCMQVETCLRLQISQVSSSSFTIPSAMQIPRATPQHKILQDFNSDAVLPPDTDNTHIGYSAICQKLIYLRIMRRRDSTIMHFSKQGDSHRFGQLVTNATTLVDLLSRSSPPNLQEEAGKIVTQQQHPYHFSILTKCALSQKVKTW